MQICLEQDKIPLSWGPKDSGNKKKARSCLIQGLGISPGSSQLFPRYPFPRGVQWKEQGSVVLWRWLEGDIHPRWGKLDPLGLKRHAGSWHRAPATASFFVWNPGPTHRLPCVQENPLFSHPLSPHKEILPQNFLESQNVGHLAEVSGRSTIIIGLSWTGSALRPKNCKGY